MTTFPSLVPNAISLSHGLPQVSEYTAFGVGPVRFRHTDFVNGQEYQLTYTALDQDSIQLLRDHYQDTGGTSRHFDVPVSVLPGLNSTDSSSRYRYTETPAEEHIGFQRYNITISIKAVVGVEMRFILSGVPATLPAEEAVDIYVFSGTAPFILNGSSSALATLILKAD